MATSFNTIFIPATPPPSLQQGNPGPTLTSFDSRQFLLQHFPDLSTLRMAEYAANVVSYLWSTSFSDSPSGPIPMHSSSQLKETFTNILLSLESPTIVIILALKYMHRLRASFNHSSLNPDHVTRLFVSCLLLATKYHLDGNTRNSEWSARVGITVAELSEMERWLLRQFRYDLGITSADFFLWVRWLGSSWRQPKMDRKRPRSHLEKLHYLQRVSQYGNLSSLSGLSLLASLATLARVTQG
ncbi:hypothetical protein K493DRAFT_313169 [Basidiobolus meristosporus CBS 931.73]|uniref:Cyclin N-terminal domain-containing protein n=1 Tax=Basidiobolus meristosporus CBS 931.73 TaxID=1314790 RepID=A0A1Y1YP95_9FUNG|nr:hypothetical protein K493DRAFT_313169 [Basidiobolus meristosporus CBS 931.73]|eukprot:ORX99586.1 hypothetical protein K493DRAFT_313169 [Basidiobolus meristosporus CBS 931.73]